MPAECFHVGVFIVDEMEARGWGPDEFVTRMGGDEQTQEVNAFGLDVCLACALDGRTGVLLGAGLAEGLEQAFGIPAKTWLALDAAWQAWATYQETRTAEPSSED